VLPNYLENGRTGKTMNESLTIPRFGAAPPSPAVQGPPLDAADDPQPVALAVEMVGLGALLTVLTTISRLGCQTTYVHASERWAALGVLAPRRIAHRLVPCVDELLEVISVTWGEGPLPIFAARPGGRADE
jgi:hypothetical protein